MMVHALMWPFCYSGVSNTLYLLLTTRCFINMIFTYQKYTHVETQTFNIVAYQCLDCSSLIPKGKMPMCIYKNTLNIKLDLKSTFPVQSPWTAEAIGEPEMVQRQKPKLSSAPSPSLAPHGALWWYQMILHIWQQRYVRCLLTATFCSQPLNLALCLIV